MERFARHWTAVVDAHMASGALPTEAALFGHVLMLWKKTVAAGNRLSDREQTLSFATPMDLVEWCDQAEDMVCELVGHDDLSEACFEWFGHLRRVGLVTWDPAGPRTAADIPMHMTIVVPTDLTDILANARAG